MCTKKNKLPSEDVGALPPSCHGDSRNSRGGGDSVSPYPDNS